MAERRIRITGGSVKPDAVLDDSNTAQAVWDALPLSIPGDTWGDEIYFGIPVKAKPERRQGTGERGVVGYWPPASSFCIFFGRTPASRGHEIRPASPVNVFGRVLGDPTAFKKVSAGTPIRIDRA